MSQDAQNPARFDFVYCRNCSYCLTGVRSNQCPECGKAFDASDGSTLSADPTQTHRTAAALRCMQVLHRVFLALLAVTAMTFFLSDSLGLWVGLLLLACIVLLMTTQTYIAFKVFGLSYAMMHLFIAIALSVFLTLGFILMPIIVRLDVLRRWQLKPDMIPSAHRPRAKENDARTDAAD